jgi:uncharacterized membrane protein
MGGPGPYYQPGAWPAPPARRRPWLFIGIAIAFVAVAALILIFVLYSASTAPAHSAYPYRFGLFGGVFFLFFILIVVFFIVRVAFWSSRASRYGGGYGRGPGPGYGRNRPAMVARMRYARGEITREQYDQIMTDLGRHPPPP